MVDINYMKIEIIIPAYNCISTLHRTLSSLETQTDIDFLVHIIDDCSTEDLSPIIEQHKSLNIRLTRNERNKGCGMTRQVGIDSTEADYIAFLDSDDVLMPYTVEMWKNMAKEFPSTDVFHSYIYEQVKANSKTAMALHEFGFNYCHGKLYKVDFIRKYDIRNREDIKYADDSFFNSICTELGEVAIIPLPMYVWLNNENSITRRENLFAKGSAHDFIMAMIHAVEFLRENGINEIKHLPNTIKNMAIMEHMFDEKTKEAYQKLKQYA